MVSFITIFRIIAFLEGLSYILLLFIATPIKYAFNNPEYVKLLGMPHGLLFIIYIIFSFMIKNELKWTNNVFLIVVLASIVPFGTFYIDKKYLKPV